MFHKPRFLKREKERIFAREYKKELQALKKLTLGLDAAGEPGFGGLIRAMLTALRRLVADGLLTAQERDRMVIPTVGRAEPDFLAPFAPSGRFEGLSIEHLELFDAEDLFWSRYRVAAALDGGLSDPRAGLFLERLESGVAALLAADPAPTTIPLAAIVMVKHPKQA